MSQNKLLLLAAFSAFLAIHFHVSSSSGFNNSIPYNCTQVSSCGNILNISYPFRLEGDPANCGDLNYQLSCVKNLTILSWDDKRFLVKAIDYNNSTIRIADVGVQAGDCSSRPINSLSYYEVPGSKRDGYCGYWYSLYAFPTTRATPFGLALTLAYVSCESPVNSSTYVDASACIIQTNSTNNTRSYHYVLVGDNHTFIELKPSCAIDLITFTTLDGNYNYSYMDIHKKLAYGFELSWATISCVACRGEGFCRLQNNTIIQNCASKPNCLECGIRCQFKDFFLTLYNLFRYPVYLTEQLLGKHRDIHGSTVDYGDFLYYWFWVLLTLLLASRTLFGFLCLSTLVIYKCRRKHLSMDDTLEEFLKSQNNFMPIRYSYSQIKKMSRRFQEKLGEGGYGSVFKGKLRSGRLVAIKMLDKAKGNGQDFINEVATIGRIHHTNVVSLVGFCSDGTKQALVYDFMPKGSLDKYVLSREGHAPLSWRKMFEISLGVARGIEYLHRGCDMQILHFDIKPHNILLDENFVPKISDFGLAKLYSTNDSIVSLTAARGTIGYIAPELIYKRIGGISYKADVYSFGMLLMEMSGKRKKLDVTTDNNSSQAYFPLWVYHEMVQGKTTEDEDTIEGEEENMIKKMTIVGLWCIQIRPCDRPSMRKVIQMLEGNIENLKLPPEPTFNIEHVPAENVEESTNPIWSSLTSIGASESVRLVIDAD